MTHLDSILMRLEANHLRLTGGDGGQSFPSEIAAALREQAEEIERQKGIVVDMRKLNSSVIAERNTLRAENAGLRKDAERYRWLRTREHMDVAACWLLPNDWSANKGPASLDAAIDAANSPSVADKP